MKLLPVLKYNDENSLSCVVTLACLSARNKYRVEREEKSGKGFAMIPERKNINMSLRKCIEVCFFQISAKAL